MESVSAANLSWDHELLLFNVTGVVGVDIVWIIPHSLSFFFLSFLVDLSILYLLYRALQRPWNPVVPAEARSLKIQYRASRVFSVEFLEWGVYIVSAYTKKVEVSKRLLIYRILELSVTKCATLLLVN